MRIEYWINSKTNYGEAHCVTCDKSLGWEDAGLEKLAPAQIGVLNGYLAKHREQHKNHSLKLVIHNRVPTYDEIKRAVPENELNHTHNLPRLTADELRARISK